MSGTSKSHAELRLDSRVVPEVADRAFALLRDRVGLKALLDAHAPTDDAKELALALADGDQPAFLVVTRTGRAVTCLGAGMTPHGPVVPFPVVDAHLRDARARLAMQIAVQRNAALDDDERPLERIARAPDALVRADFELLERLFPLVEGSLREAASTTLLRLHRARARGSALDDDARRALAALVGLSAHALVLGRAAPAFQPALLTAYALGDRHLAPRALWALANRPGPTLDAVERLIVDEREAAPPLLPLLRVIAARHEAHAGRALALITRAGGEAATVDLTLARAGLVFLLHLPLLAGRYCPRAVRDLAPDARRALVANATASVDGMRLPLRATAERLGPWFTRMVDLLDPERWLRHVSPDVLAAPTQHQGERVRVLLWRTMLASGRTALRHWPLEVQAVLSAAPFVALVPGARPSPRARFTLTVDDVASDAPRAPAPAVAAPTVAPVGRNDPCPCGSGQKYKRCHGAA